MGRAAKMATKKTPADKIRARLKSLSHSILANPIEASNQFFAGLKPILKTAGHIEQQEILISRIECRLL
jgi:hypothetical protein